MRRPKIGIFYHGHLADIRLHPKTGQPVSSPEGLFFFVWPMIQGLQERGCDVYMMNPDRDHMATKLHGAKAFQSFAQDDRWKTYLDMYQFLDSSFNPRYISCNPVMAMKVPWPQLDALIFEWRWPIPGRNTENDRDSKEYTWDLDMLQFLLSYYAGRTKLIGLDLDYKMSPEDERKWQINHVFEFGFKRGRRHHIDVPFVMKYMNTFPVEAVDPDKTVVYVGNRYERDEQIDKYLSDAGQPIHLYGNWLDRGRDSAERWPHIHFHGRIQPHEFRNAYRDAGVVPLLAKDEYCQHGFMTPRLLEVLFYGAVPAMVEEFQTKVEYGLPLVRNSQDVAALADIYVHNYDVRKRVVVANRERMGFCDCSAFARKVIEVL